MARKKVSNRLRFQIFRRDGFTCQYCGAKGNDVVLEVDHLDPVSNGGSNDAENLLTSCYDCNRGKSDAIVLKEIEKAKKLEGRERANRMVQIFNEIVGDEYTYELFMAVVQFVLFKTHPREHYSMIPYGADEQIGRLIMGNTIELCRLYSVAHMEGVDDCQRENGYEQESE